MKIVLAVSAFVILNGHSLALASSLSSVAEMVGADAVKSEAVSGPSSTLTEKVDFDDVQFSPNSATKSELGAQTGVTADTKSKPVASEVGGEPKVDGSDSDSVATSEDQPALALRRPLQFEFVTADGRKIEGLSTDQLDVDKACAWLTARDDLEVLERLAKCIRPSALGNYTVSSIPEVVASTDVIRFIVPVAINRFKTIRLDARMKDGSKIPVNCSPQVSLTNEAGFAEILPMVESLAENRQTLEFAVEFPDHMPVSSTTFRIQTTGSSGCRLAEGELGLKQGKALGKLVLDENGAVFTADLVPSDPALLIILTQGDTASTDGRLGREWRRQASAIIETAFDFARKNFSQVIVAGYNENSQYKVFLKVPKTQFREQLKKIKNDNDFGFKIDSSGLGLDSSLRVDLDEQIAELAGQGISVVTIIYGREQSDASLCDLGSLASGQLMERLGGSLIVDVLPSKSYNFALKSARSDEKIADAVIIRPSSELFSAVDCVKYAGLVDNRQLSADSNVYALPLLKADEDLSNDYLELSRKWLGELLENAQ
jgi:hypothetical protein